MARTIVIVCHSGNNFDVIEDGAISDHLCWDEMLWQIASMTHPKIGEPRYRAHTCESIRDYYLNGGKSIP